MVKRENKLCSHQFNLFTFNLVILNFDCLRLFNCLIYMFICLSMKLLEEQIGIGLYFGLISSLRVNLMFRVIEKLFCVRFVLRLGLILILNCRSLTQL